MTINVFISYSHQDEWLKDELDQHLGSMKRSGVIDVWHDRKIVAGQKFKDEIDAHATNANVFLFLISSAFISSDYCIKIEFLTAKEKHEKGEAVLIPIIVRDCDWDIYDLRDFQALPKDAEPVTRGAASRDDEHKRDAKWAQVVKGIKDAVAALKKKLTPPDLNPNYAANLFNVDFVRHPSLPTFNERQFFIDPEVYFENEKRQLNKISEILNEIEKHSASIFTGSDRSGKSLIAKYIQTELTERGEPAVIIKGSKISNADIQRIVKGSKAAQLSEDFPDLKTSIILDDFDECTLPDAIKEKIVHALSKSYKRLVMFSFSTAPSVLFTPDDLPDPATFVIEPLGDEKIYQLVKLWRNTGSSSVLEVEDEAILQSHEKILLLFSQTEVQKYPYNVVSFLELLDSSVGADLAPSSFASCYEALIQQRLIRQGVNPTQHDEMKNFLSLVAYKAYQEGQSGFVSKEGFTDCVDVFVEQFFSSAVDLKKVSIDHFLIKNDTGYYFSEDYLWYFLCARYVGRTLIKNDQNAYHAFIEKAAINIFQKKYANIIIYLAYFTDDNAVLKELMILLDQLFAKADDWRLSDRSRSVILGLAHSDELTISASSDIDDNRIQLMKQKVKDVVGDAEDVVAKYALPFLDPQIDDSELVSSIPEDRVDTDSYLKSVNALMRTHSVIGQILSSRSGTYGANLVLDCISKMVQASGRYASLNHAIATVLMFDPEAAEKSANAVLRVDDLTSEEKQKKVMRIFAFWSVYLSQTGLARYLNQEHSIRALSKLVEVHEADKYDDGHFPFNFTSVLLIAKLYNTGSIDRNALSDAIDKYGRDSSLFAVIRAAIHIYSYYMPMSIKDKQWISQQLGIPLRAIEMQSLKSKNVKKLTKSKLLEINPERQEE